ncbi:DNA-3-methyladenine glycosylase family protein [Blastococcus litoris]|uniref:DNA-3-methyladenine glycosylase family protein n=1 Tax=Blastococcus litoris TaxID=2171622 RepID=UPI000E305ADD|nr:DNA-3-methyladenine glycosylase 2 family protein [Blastococcus litoris]
MTTDEVDVQGIDLEATLGALAWLPGDPTLRTAPGRFERATLTPDGPGGLVVTWSGSAARIEAGGPGGTWLLTRAPGLLGLLDDVTGFDPREQPVRDLWRRNRGRRIARTSTLWHDAAYLIVQQRISRVDAAAQWKRLVHGYGSPSETVPGLVHPPDPATVGRLGSADFHRLGIDRRRAEHLVSAARAARALAPLVDRPFEEALPAVRSVRGLGPWTCSCLGARCWGDRDIAIVGDDGIPSMVAWTLAGEPRADDARMLELLEPHRPHRQRVLQLVLAGGRRPPRYGPRRRANDIRGR